MANDIPVERGTKAGNLFSGKMRVITPEEEAFMSGKTIAKPREKARRVGTTSDDPSDRLVPDGKGGFRKIEDTPAGVPPVQAEPVVADTPVAATAAPVPAKVEEPKSDDVIRINDEHRKVTIKCKGKFIPCGLGTEEYSTKAEFSVCVEAASVDISDEGVSLLIRKEIVLNPPTLVAMTLEIGDTSFNVTYAGGKHRLGSYVNMPFTRL